MYACRHTLLQLYFLWTHNGKEIPHIAPEYLEIHQMLLTVGQVRRNWGGGADQWISHSSCIHMAHKCHPTDPGAHLTHTIDQCFPYFLRRGALFRTEICRGALSSVAYPGIFFGSGGGDYTRNLFRGGGVQQIQL
jgi:hypothetical protein